MWQLVNELKEVRQLLQLQQTKQIPPPSSTDYLSRKEVAEKLRMSLVTLDEYTKKGAIKGNRIGRRVLYKSSDVDSALSAIKTRGGH